jgi:hypothetical protein
LKAKNECKRPMKRIFNPDLLKVGNKHLYVACFLFLLSFVITKLTFFFYYPVWCTTSDIYSYSDPVISLTKHQWPVFDMRTPVYPMFLAATYFAGLSLDGVLLIQMFSTLVACLVSVYVIFKYKRGFFLPFSIILLIFFSSGDVTAMDANVSPTSLFADLMLVFTVCFMAGIESQKKKYFIGASLLFAGIILLRPQGLFLIGIVLAVCIIYFVNYRSTNFLVAFLLPAIIIYAMLLAYNYATFGMFKYSKFDTMSKLGYIINTIDVSPDYPQALNDRIKDYQLTMGGNCRDVICSQGFNFQSLDTVYNNDRYSYCWAFLPIIKSNPEAVEKLIANSGKSCPQNAWKEFIVCFIRYYQKMECKTNYFYFNELINRKHYIEGSENYYDVVEKREFYPIVWRNWSKQVVDHYAGKYPILDAGTDFDKLRKQQPVVLRLINIYDVVYNAIFSNKVWLLLYLISTLMAGVILLYNFFRFAKMDAILLLPFFPFLNSILVSLIIPPIYYYIFPTRFFFMLSPFIVIFYLLNSRKGNTTTLGNAPAA